MLKKYNTSPKYSLPEKDSVITYIIDIMALINKINASELPKTYEELVFVILDKIPKGYTRVDIVADTYLENSIKDAERKRRGVGERIIVTSEKTKLPKNFNSFLHNGHNKTRLIEIIIYVIKQNRMKVLQDLCSNVVVFSSCNECIRLSKEGSCEIEYLCSNQE